jgi:hypothetical protein
MHYQTSFKCRSLSAPSCFTEKWTVNACRSNGKLIEPPTLALLSHISPQLFRVDVQHNEGRIYVNPERVNAAYPCLPGHLALMALFRQNARTLFVDPAVLPPADPDADPAAPLALSPDLCIGHLCLAPEWGGLDPVPSPYLPVTLQGARVHYGRHLPHLPLAGSTLAVVPELSVPQWQAQYPALQLLREGYDQSAALHLLTLEDLPRAVQQLQQAVPAQAFPGAAYPLAPQEALALCCAEALAPFPLLQCWQQHWHALWLNHCPVEMYALLLPVRRTETVLLERRLLPAPSLCVLQQQALLLGVPYSQVYSPWLAVELRRGLGPPGTLPALRPVTQHWCHLSRAWHHMYAQRASILGKLQVGLGIDAPNHIRIMSPATCMQHWQSCSRKRKTPSGQQAFVAGQLAALGGTCTVCLEQSTTTLLRCGHALCLGCAQQCLWRQGKCPQCRQVLTTPSCAYYITRMPLSAAAVRQVYGGKLAAVWALLHGWGSGASVVLVGQITQQAQRRLAAVLRQLQLPCQCLLGPRKLEQLLAFRDGSMRRLILTPTQMSGLALPAVDHAVYLHALLDADHRVERTIQAALPVGVHLHRLSLRHTVEELLAFPPPHAP